MRPIHRQNDGPAVPAGLPIPSKYVIIKYERQAVMAKNYSAEELNHCSKKELMQVVLSLQDQLDRLNENYENLIEQIRIANSTASCPFLMKPKRFLTDPSRNLDSKKSSAGKNPGRKADVRRT